MSSNSSGFSLSSSSSSSGGNGVGGASYALSMACAIAAPIMYAINGILDKTVISIRVRHEHSYIAMVGIVDIFLG